MNRSQSGTLDPREPSWAVHRWALWSLPRPILGYLLVVQAVALAAVLASASSPVTGGDIGMGGAIVGAMFLHLHLSQLTERIHRTRRRTPHIDLGWVWIFPGALLLPPLLAAALPVLMSAQRWWLFGRLDGRPPYRRLFNAGVLVLSTLAAAGVVTLTGRRGHLAADPGGWADLSIVLLAAAVAFAVNSALVAGVLTLTTGARRPPELLGDLHENLLDAATLLLGACVALSAAWWAPFAALVVLPAIVLHRTVLIHQLELAARTDEKTGVLNAVAWTEQARAELSRTQRHGGSMAVFMIDMDGFKLVNDEHGHLVGDTVLQRVARVLAAEVRRTDAVGRFGGDEFAVLLPATDVSEALAVAERIRREIRQLPVPVATGLSLSVGVAVYPYAAEETVEGLLAAADAALYWAKDNGRDQIRLAAARQGQINFS